MSILVFKPTLLKSFHKRVKDRDKNLGLQNENQHCDFVFMPGDPVGKCLYNFVGFIFVVLVPARCSNLVGVNKVNDLSMYLTNIFNIFVQFTVERACRLILQRSDKGLKLFLFHNWRGTGVFLLDLRPQIFQSVRVEGVQQFFCNLINSFAICLYNEAFPSGQ